MRMTQSEVDAHRRRVGRSGVIVKADAPAKPEKRSHGAVMQPKRHAKGTDYSRRLAQQIRDAGLRQPILEYAFDRQLEGTGLRDWRIDLAYPSWTVMSGRRGKPLAVEVDGAAHRIKARHKGDFTKHQALFASGWDLLRVSTEQVRNGEALELVRRALT